MNDEQGIRGILHLLHSKGNQAAEDGFYVVITLMNAALVTAALILLYEFTAKNSLNLTMCVIASVGFPPLVGVTRTYIAMHPDAHIEEHLIKSAAAIGGLFGPAIFLFAETFSCYTTEDDHEVACGRLKIHLRGLVPSHLLGRLLPRDRYCVSALEAWTRF